MSRVEFRPFKLDHLMNLGELPNEPRYREHRMWPSWVQDMRDSDIVRSLFVDYHLVAVCGVSEEYPGVAEVWAAFNAQGLQKYAKSVTRATGQWFDWVQDTRKYWRLFAIVLDRDVNVRYLRHYGFEVEGILHHHDPFGNDMVVMGRVKEAYLGSS